MYNSEFHYSNIMASMENGYVVNTEPKFEYGGLCYATQTNGRMEYGVDGTSVKYSYEVWIDISFNTRIKEGTALAITMDTGGKIEGIVERMKTENRLLHLWL